MKPSGTCQVARCDEPALTAVVVSLDELELEVELCTVHEAVWAGELDRWLGVVFGREPA